MTTLVRSMRRAVAMALTASVALTLFAATAVFADDSSDFEWTDGEFTLSATVSTSTSGTLYLGIRWR